MTTLAQISSSQVQKEVAANENFLATAQAGLFGKRIAGTTGLTFGFYGGYINVDGVLTSVADGTVALTASITNYIEATRAGVVSKNTSGFTAGQIPLFTALTDTTVITTLTDFRTWASIPWTGNWLTKAYPSDANYTLTAAEARAKFIRMTGTIGAQRNLVVPLFGDWLVNNTTAGGFGVQVIGASGTGIVIANAKQAFVYGDGTNIVRATADV